MFYLLTIINAGIGFKFTGIFDKLTVNNFIMIPASNTLFAAFAKTPSGTPFNLFGFDLSNPAQYTIGLSAIVEEPTLIFEYEIIKEVGLIGTIFVVGFFAAMFVFVTRYVRDSKDSAFLKNVIVMMLVAFMLICTFGFNVKSQPHDSSVYQAFLRSVPFMIALFLFGYTYFVPEKVEFVKDEKKVEEDSLWD